jgi:hypothetical protein
MVGSFESTFSGWGEEEIQIVHHTNLLETLEAYKFLGV